MKKIILILALLILTASPAQADAATFAFYRPYLTSNTGLLLYNTPDFVPFVPTSFDTRMDGLFALQPDGRFTTDYVGMAKVTGHCVQGKSSFIEMRLVIDGYSMPVLVAQTLSKAFTFTFPFVANDLSIQVFNHSQGTYTLLKCDIVFEVIG